MTSVLLSRRTIVRRPWLSLGFLDWALVATVVGVAFLVVELPYNLEPVDGALLIVLIAGASTIRRRENPFSRPLRTALPWLWLLALVSVVSMIPLGLVGWGVTHALRDLGALVTPFLLGAILWSRRTILGNLFVVWAGTATVVALTTFVNGPGLRQTGEFFTNPNYTAHYLATSFVVIALAPLRPLTRVVLCAVVLSAILPTGSFGGLAVIIGAAAAVGSRLANLVPGSGRHAATALLIIGFSVFSVWSAGKFVAANVDLGSGASSTRFDRSSERRFDIWRDAAALTADRPLGVAPGGLKNRDDLDVRKSAEVHNDYLGFLVDLGYLGLVAAAGVAVVIWRTLPRGGTARLLFVGLLFAAIFRDTVNFRHLWLAVALLAVSDFMQRSRARSRSVGAEPIEVAA